ncbi:T9SS type A sorting domain-containing protein [bacterium]|nr:T9SS type A sorting domain-containing protein [bacterium]
MRAAIGVFVVFFVFGLIAEAQWTREVVADSLFRLLSVQLPESSTLNVRVYNIAGQQVAILADGDYSSGVHSFVFNGAEMASGVYFVHAEVPGKLDEIRKLTLLK